MSWLKLDDAMGEHKKLTRSMRDSRCAVALHFFGLLHCSRYLTDGFVEDKYVSDVASDARIRPAEMRKALATLVEHELWKPVSEHESDTSSTRVGHESDTSPTRVGGFLIHDYLKYNPSRAQVLLKRENEASRKRKGRDAQTDKRPAGQTPESKRGPAAVRPPSDGPVPSRPITTQPFIPSQEGKQLTGSSVPGDLAPQKPAGNRKTDQDRHVNEMAAWVAHHFPDAPSVGGVVGAMGFARTSSASRLRAWAAHAPEQWSLALGLTLPDDDEVAA